MGAIRSLETRCLRCNDTGRIRGGPNGLCDCQVSPDARYIIQKRDEFDKWFNKVTLVKDGQG